MKKGTVQMWVSKETKRKLRMKAASEGIPLYRYLDKLVGDDPTMQKNFKEIKRGTWYGL